MYSNLPSFATNANTQLLFFILSKEDDSPFSRNFILCSRVRSFVQSRDTYEQKYSKKILIGDIVRYG